MKKLLAFALLNLSILLALIILDFVNLKNFYRSLSRLKSGQTFILPNNTNIKSTNLRSGDKSSVLYDFDEKYNANYLIINLSDSRKVCFKSQIGLDNKVAKTDSNGKLLKNFVQKKFIDLINDENSKLNNYYANASFNTSFFRKTDSAPLDINFIQGINYSVTRDWTSLNISKDNNISFVREISDKLYNTAGGGPKVITNKIFTNPCENNSLTGDTCINEGNGANLFSLRRTMAGVTENNYLIVIASSKLYIYQIEEVFKAIADKEQTGKVVEATMFDGGSSVSMAYKDDASKEFSQSDVKISGDQIVSSMLIYKGDACSKRY